MQICIHDEIVIVPTTQLSNNLVDTLANIYLLVKNFQFYLLNILH